MDFQKGEKDYLKLFMAVDPSVNSARYNITRREIQLALQNLNKKKFQKAKPDKKITLLYESVNREIFRQYRENVLFPEIFKNGTFNCLTASAYYGLLLDSLHIPFEFRESYNHVLPVAYPCQLQIQIETTDPVSGVNNFDEKLKFRFVNYLVDTKRITHETYDTSSIDAIFNRYYMPEKNIGLQELTGLQYMNDALYLYGGGKLCRCFRADQKGLVPVPVFTDARRIPVYPERQPVRKRFQEAGRCPHYRLPLPPDP